MRSSSAGTRVRARRWVTLAHAWLGVTSALFVILVAGSGAALAFMSDLFLAQYGDMLRTERPSNSAPMLDVDALLASAQAGAPTPFTPIGVLMPHTRVAGVETALPFGMPDGGKGFEDLRMYSVDPWTGAYKGDFRLDDAWGHQLVHFHQDFFLGSAASIFVAVIGMMLAAFALSGLWLWWPRGTSALTKATRLDLAGGAKRAFFSLHGWVGVWTALAALFFALTGVGAARPHWLGLPEEPEPATLHAGFSRVCDGAVSPAEAARAAVSAHSGRALATLYFPEAEGEPYRLTLAAPNDLDTISGDLVVFVHASCVGVEHSIDIARSGIRARLAAASLSLHGGYNFGQLMGKGLVILTGLALVVVPLTGIVVFFSRPYRLRARSARPSRSILKES